MEKSEFVKLLDQDVILENMVLTGLRGVGKTVLLETFKPSAISEGWRWVGTDLSESASITEETLALRLITDLAVVTSGVLLGSTEQNRIGFGARARKNDVYLNHGVLIAIFDSTPGLVSDKLKAVLETVWDCLNSSNRKRRGIIFAYDEAQTISDHAEKDQYPLSVLLDVFQSIQKKGIPFMLALTGLPTLFPKLVEARTYAERMFRVVFLSRLNHEHCRLAIVKPLKDVKVRVVWDETSVKNIIELSDGYPYFIQFICKEVFDVFAQEAEEQRPLFVPIDEIVGKLDEDFFQGRWARATDRQRDLLAVIARLPNCDSEFTVQEIVSLSKKISAKPFSSSHVNQMLSSLGDSGLVYKNRYGKYSFAVPLLGRFILRQLKKLESRGQAEFRF